MVAAKMLKAKDPSKHDGTIWVGYHQQQGGDGSGAASNTYTAKHDGSAWQPGSVHGSRPAGAAAWIGSSARTDRRPLSSRALGLSERPWGRMGRP